jgi:hypothetical protein
MAEQLQAGAILDQTAGLINCPGSPLILTEPDSDALDSILNIWARYHDEGMDSCYGRIVLATPGIYRLTSEVRSTRVA